VASSRVASPAGESAASARVSLKQQMERLTDAYLASVLQLEEYKRRKLELEQRLSVIAEQKRQLEANVGHHDQLGFNGAID
jgi:site-specific DNA recombinase